MDILVAGGALLFFAPLLAFVALLIKLESPGPVLFRQSRGGLNGQAFTIFKFRSMRCQENGSKVVQAQRDDDRITTLGKIIRKTSIDELPQLINVLRGDMSRNRTGVHGFAVRCVTTPPPGHPVDDANHVGGGGRSIQEPPRGCNFEFALSPSPGWMTAVLDEKASQVARSYQNPIIMLRIVIIANPCVPLAA